MNYVGYIPCAPNLGWIGHIYWKKIELVMDEAIKLATPKLHAYIKQEQEDEEAHENSCEYDDDVDDVDNVDNIIPSTENSSGDGKCPSKDEHSDLDDTISQLQDKIPSFSPCYLQLLYPKSDMAKYTYYPFPAVSPHNTITNTLMFVTNVHLKQDVLEPL